MISMLMTQMAKYMDDARYAEHPSVKMMKEMLAKMGMNDVDATASETMRDIAAALDEEIESKE